MDELSLSVIVLNDASPWFCGIVTFHGYQSRNSNTVTTLTHPVQWNLNWFETLLTFSFFHSCAPLSVRSSLSLGSSADPDPGASAAVTPAGPGSAPGCGRAAFSQPAEQHHWGQHLGLRSRTHYPAAPVTAHPDRLCKTLSPLFPQVLKEYLTKCHHCERFWSWLYDWDTQILFKWNDEMMSFLSFLLGKNTPWESLIWKHCNVMNKCLLLACLQVEIFIV